MDAIIKLGERLTIWYGSADYPAMVLGSPWMQTLVEGSQLRVVAGGKHSFKSEPQHYAAIVTGLREQAKKAVVRENLGWANYKWAE